MRLEVNLVMDDVLEGRAGRRDAEVEVGLRQAVFLRRLVQALRAGLVEGSGEVLDTVAGGSKLPRQHGHDEDARQ
jgi:hypothetical protein